MVLFIRLYEVSLTFDSVDEILKCNHSNKVVEQYSSVALLVFH